MTMRIEQHLMCLQGIGSDDESLAVPELAVRDPHLIRVLLAPREEPTNRFVDMIVSRPVSHQPRAVAEVSRPATQKIVQPGAHFIPRSDIGGDHRRIEVITGRERRRRWTAEQKRTSASQLLCRSQTSPGRASAATAPRLPAADHPP
jgi:hypothetical protein